MNSFFRKTTPRLLIGLALLGAAIWFGRHVADDLKEMEAWIAGHGAEGRLAFVGLMVLLTSLFIPDTLLAVAAGVMFGLAWGAVLTVTGAILTAVVNFFAARTLLQPTVQKMLAGRPKLRAIQQAAQQEGLKLQLLLRLAPINPVTVSYVLGASGVRFWVYLTATLALIPGLFVEVYFGYVASHVTKAAGAAAEHSRLHMAVTVAGFVVCVVLMITLSRFVSRALAEAELEPRPAADEQGS